jgi:hydrogenase maturation protein HypF
MSQGETMDQPKIRCNNNNRHLSIHIEGIVQGVGFRPFVYNLAHEYNLTGSVCNTTNGVYIHVEGNTDAIDRFVSVLTTNPPPLAHIQAVACHEMPLQYFPDFRILASDPNLPKHTLVSPDAAICSDCRREILDPNDRRYLYPFTNCTNCGPRYTIIRDIPYDRPMTTMASFPMCPTCTAEYDDPGDRRFHAQPNACPVCGPQVSILDMQGNLVSGFWLEQFHNKILAGNIFGIKSLGGFHLACRADNPDAVKKLRDRKKRPAKPFAVMCRDMATVKKIAHVSSDEENLLTSPHAPIVLLRIREKCPTLDAVAPGLSTVGVMLPYTPLHCLLFTGSVHTMVMTSGNRNSLPLTYQNDAAISELAGLADYLMIHDRDIQNRCDDSVVSIFKSKPYFYRRSRGYSPLPVQTPVKCADPVLALGSDMKNTYCILKGDQAFLGPHIGDLYNQETLDYYVRSFQDMTVFLDSEPKITAHDLHPSFMSTQAAKRSSQLEKPIAVQHHHAHMAACMAENMLDEPVLGAILDGTGYGTDGNIWGFEILHGDYSHYQRLYHLAELPIPGGEAAIRHPWRMACSYLWQYIEESTELTIRLFPQHAEQIMPLLEIWQRRLNSPLTSSCGRLFDAVSSLLDICTETTYEGQAAVELMEQADPDLPFHPYAYDILDDIIMPEKTIAMIVNDLLSGTPKANIAARFHHTIAAMVVSTLKFSRNKTQCSKVVLSGGVFQNEKLLAMVLDLLKENSFEVYIHRKVPTNDGGIALGQAMVACAQNP